MPGELHLIIPRAQDPRTRLVKSVPAKGWLVSGTIHAPQIYYVRNMIAEKTGLLFRRGNPAAIVGEHAVGIGDSRIPNIFEMILDHKWPSFLSFDSAELDAVYSDPTHASCKRFLATWLTQNYGGGLRGTELTFHRFRTQESSDPVAECTIQFNPQTDIAGAEDPSDSRSSIKIKWKETENDVEPILATCRELQLREYIPVPPRNPAEVRAEA